MQEENNVEHTNGMCQASIYVSKQKENIIEHDNAKCHVFMLWSNC